MAAADGPTLDRVLAALEQQGAETAARFDQLQEVLVTMPQLRTPFTTLQSQVQGMAQVVAGNSDSLAETGTVIQSIQGQVLDVKQQAQALGTKQEVADVELAVVQKSIQEQAQLLAGLDPKLNKINEFELSLSTLQQDIETLKKQYARTQEIRRDSALSTEALQEHHGVGNDGNDVGENELVTEIEQIEPQTSPPEPQPPPPSQYDDGEVYDIDKELQRLGAQIINLGRRRRQKRPNVDPIGALREFLIPQNFMGAPDKTVKTDEGRATTTPTTDNRRVSFMAMPITTSGQRTSSPNAAEEAEFSKVYEIFTPADVLDKNFKDQSTDMNDEEEDNKVSAKDLELPDDCKWGGHKTMFSTDNDDKRGIFQTLENLTKLFEHRNVKSHRQRKAMLLRAILPNMSRTKLEQHLEAHDTVHEAVMSFPELRRLALNFFSPQDWLQQMIKAWINSIFQDKRAGSTWLPQLLRWTRLLNATMPAGSVAIGHNFTALLMRAGAAGPLQTQLAMERYAIYDYHQAVSAVERCYNRVANEGAETGQAQLNKFGLRDDKEIRAALNMSRHVTACLKRMKYTGMLKDWLMNKTTGGGSVSEQEFNQRMRNKKCAACGAPDHLLITCPEYIQDYPKDVLQAGIDRGRTMVRGQQDRSDRVFSRNADKRHYRQTGEQRGALAPQAKVLEQPRRARFEDSAHSSVKYDDTEGENTDFTQSEADDDAEFMFDDDSGNESGEGEDM